MKKSKIEHSINGSVSIEKLHHFRCGACNKWWSIGDPQIIETVLKREWFCPWCGLKQKIKGK
jgi:hypothetical protein